MVQECHVCGDDEFECENGLYFCTNCNTQSQHAVQEETEDAYGLDVRSIIRTKPKPKIKEKDTDVTKKDTRPWVMIEGFTILLREQVQALITMGASPRLKDVMLKLWMHYLKTTGQAFLTENDSDIKSRAAFIPTFETQRNVAPYAEATAKSGESVQRRQALRAVFGGEEFYEEDNPLAEPTEELTQEDMIRSEYKEIRRKITKKKKLSGKRILYYEKARGQKLFLQHSLGFLYIALHYTNNAVSLNDLLRAVNNGEIPYNHGPMLFPDNMQMSMVERNFFCNPFMPKLSQLTKHTNKLVEVLDVKLPQPNMELFTLRCIFDLNLPAGLHGLVRALMKEHQPRNGAKRMIKVSDYHTLAMAFIVLAVKIVFALDDETEDQISPFTNDVLEALGPESEVHLFDWRVWMKDQVVRNVHPPSLFTHWSDVHATDNIKLLLKRFDIYESTRVELKGREFESRNQKTIIKLLQQMCGKAGIDLPSNTENSDPGEDPDKSRGQKWSLGSDCRPDKIENDHFEDMTQYSIQHILDWEGFVEIVNEHEISKNINHQDNTSESGSVREKLDHLDGKLPKAWEKYPCYKLEYANHAYTSHKSYHFLLERASYFCGNFKILHNFVQNLELLYMPCDARDRQRTHAKSRKRLFQKRYFACGADDDDK